MYDVAHAYELGHHDCGRGSGAVRFQPAGVRCNLLDLSSTTVLAQGEFPIQGGSAIHFKFSVPSGASDVLLEGTFTATGGSSNDVAMALFSSDEFAKSQDQGTATALYESGRTHQAQLNIKLPPDAGTYYLVFSNNFLLSTPKVVRASVRLHYKL
jgi:hypothetical protein